MATNLNLIPLIKESSPQAKEKMKICMGCPELNTEFKCNKMQEQNINCPATTYVKWDWKACPLGKFPSMDELFERYQQGLINDSHKEQRKLLYPDIYDFVDAWVKNDEEALEEYRQKCLTVKQLFPKS